MAKWCQSVEERFYKMESRLSRLEGEMIVIIVMLGLVIGLLVKLMSG